VCVCQKIKFISEIVLVVWTRAIIIRKEITSIVNHIRLNPALDNCVYVRFLGIRIPKNYTALSGVVSMLKKAHLNEFECRIS